jgi:hypothetical protein
MGTGKSVTYPNNPNNPLPVGTYTITFQVTDPTSGQVSSASITITVYYPIQ